MEYLFTLETHDVKDSTLSGLLLQYEMSYTNIINMLDLWISYLEFQ